MRWNNLIISLFLVSVGRTQEVPIDEVTISCGNHFFSETGREQAPLIVRGWWCGNSYFWIPASLGDTLQEPAYYKEFLFTGSAVARDTLGRKIGYYSFRDGLLTSLKEFRAGGGLLSSYHYEAGIPHGSQRDYDWNGDLILEKNFNHGILQGPFYWSKERIDSGLPSCIETGIYHNGVYEQTSEPCPW